MSGRFTSDPFPIHAECSHQSLTPWQMGAVPRRAWACSR